VSERRAWIGALLSIACLFLALRRVAWPEVLNGLRTADYGLIALAMIMQAGAVSSTALRWKALFYPQRGLRAGKFISIAFIGELVNNLLPARVGFLARIYLVGQMERVSRAFALGTIVAEKAADGVMLTVLCLFLVPLIALPVWIWYASLLSTGVLLMIVVVLTVFAPVRQVILGIIRWFATAVPLVARWHVPDGVKSGLDGLRALLRREAALPIWGWSVAMWGLGGLINLVVLGAVGLSARPVVALSLLVILQVGTKVPSLLAGIGVFEYLCVFALSLFGIASSQALVLGVLLHFVVVVPPSVIGAIALWHESRNPATLQPSRLCPALASHPTEPDKEP
jgi:uncharacterized protein (TIRG00374 family)